MNYVAKSGTVAASSVDRRGQVLFAPTPVADMELGCAVAVSGRTMVVGAENETTIHGVAAGAAYVFKLHRHQGWVFQQRLVPPTGIASNNFGFCVAIDGNTMIIGASDEPDALGGLTAGAAYVYINVGNEWVLQQRIIPTDPVATDRFGRTVEISGDTVFIAATLNDDAGANSGAVYVFTRTGGTWTQQQKLLPTSATRVGAQFGKSLSVSGTTLAVGAWGESTIGGAAYVFVLLDGVWVEQQHLTASDWEVGGQFGVGLSLDGDRLAVGSNSDDTVQGANMGSFYIFNRTGTVWAEVEHILPTITPLFAGATSADFSCSEMEMRGTTLLVASTLGGDSPGATDNGAVYLYQLTDGLWVFRARLIADDFGGPSDESNNLFGFGLATAFNGRFAVISSVRARGPASEVEAGAVYVIDLRPFLV